MTHEKAEKMNKKYSREEVALYWAQSHLTYVW